MSNIVILGSGIAGISCGFHLKEAGMEPIIYEKNDDWGGLCGNFIIDGFRFDKFVHFTFSKDKYVQEIFRKSTQLINHKPEASNYYHGTWLRHPAQNNLFPLSTAEKVKIISGFINNDEVNISEISNYEEWLKAQYGNYFSENFPMPYTKKYWTVPANQLETKWVGLRMNKPTIEDVLFGAMSEHKNNNYYTNEMRYPAKGGYKSVMNYIKKDVKVITNKEVVEIDCDENKIKFSDGKTISYEKVFSSIPLTSMVNIVKNTPLNVQQAASELLCTSGYIVSLGFNKPDIAQKLWFYIYDEDILPSRVYAPSLKSSDNVPEGCSSLQAEIYFSEKLKLEKSEPELLAHTIDKLIEMNIFKRADLIVKDIRKLNFANVVFTPKIYESRKKVRHFLKEKSIETIGRFGEWDYLWSDQSFLSGKRSADEYIMEKDEK